MKIEVISLATIALLIGGCTTKQDIKTDSSKEYKCQFKTEQNSTTLKRYGNNNSDQCDLTHVNYDDFIDETALHDAIRAKDLELVQYLLSENIKYDTKDIYGYTPLHLAARLNQLEIAKELIAKDRAVVNNLDNYKDTPLLDTTRNDFTKMSQLLICNGAYRNVTDIHDISPLHNSAKNKNLFISKMLRADDLTAYCSNLQTKIVDFDRTQMGYGVCGEYQNDIQAQSNITIINEINETIGSFDTKEKWCSKIDQTFEDGTYTLTNNAKDEYLRTAKDQVKLNIDDDMSILYRDDFKITMDDQDELITFTPSICGDVAIGDAKKVLVELKNKNTNKLYGFYNSVINSDEKRWCIDKTDILNSGEYTVKAIGINDKDMSSIAIDDLFIIKKPQVAEPFIGLYDALNEEFKDDFEPWNAQLTSDLLFRFKDPQMLFDHGKSDLKNRFEDILNDFVPRYLKVLHKYQDEISQIRVEGHTSSVYSSAQTKQEKYNLNKQLSQKRANKVTEYIDGILQHNDKIQTQWLEGIFNSYGMGYDNLILDGDGLEDEKASRRVEFKIEQK